MDNLPIGGVKDALFGPPNSVVLLRLQRPNGSTYDVQAKRHMAVTKAGAEAMHNQGRSKVLCPAPTHARDFGGSLTRLHCAAGAQVHAVPAREHDRGEPHPDRPAEPHLRRWRRAAVQPVRGHAGPACGLGLARVALSATRPRLRRRTLLASSRRLDGLGRGLAVGLQRLFPLADAVPPALDRLRPFRLLRCPAAQTAQRRLLQLRQRHSPRPQPQEHACP